jgi:hypothetical protein
MKSAERDGLVVDAITQEFQAQNPSVKFYHLFPGVVTTEASANAGFPTVVQWGFKLVGPIIGNAPDVYAEIPVHIATAQPAHRFFSKLSEVQPNKWTEIKEHRAAVFQNMLGLLQGTA